MVLRVGAKVTKSRHAELDDALRGLAEALGSTRAGRDPTSLLGREITPEQQVVARGELRGPRRLRAGVDLRGDGSELAWTGRLTRTPIAPEPGETAQDALARILA